MVIVWKGGGRSRLFRGREVMTQWNRTGCFYGF